MDIEYIIKDLEYTIKYIDIPTTETQVGRVMQAKKTLEQIKLLKMPAVSDSFCNCESSEKEQRYGYGRPVCLRCNRVVKL